MGFIYILAGRAIFSRQTKVGHAFERDMVKSMLNQLV